MAPPSRRFPENETAAFSLVLDQEGAIILEKAFEQGTTPVGVIYELEYSGLTPDLHVKITADFERIYNHFSAGLEAQIYWVRAGIDAGFEKLVQDGAIKIEVIDFEGAADREAKEKWALDFFKDDLLPSGSSRPSIWASSKGPAQPEGLDAVLDRLKKLQPGCLHQRHAAGPDSNRRPQPNRRPRRRRPRNRRLNAALPPATLTITSTTPSPLPAGRSLSLVPGSTSTSETLEVKGPAARFSPWTISRSHLTPTGGRSYCRCARHLARGHRRLAGFATRRRNVSTVLHIRSAA